MDIDVADLFAGCGGFSTGAKQAGAKVIIAIDNWDAACKVHEVNYPDTKTIQLELGGNIPYVASLINKERRPGVHFHLHGSPPCQNLSQCNTKGDRHEGMRLVWWFIDLVNYMKPDSWSMENVIPMAKFLDAHDIPNVKLNSADFGAPQTRKRCFGGEGWTAVPTHSKEEWVSVAEALPHLKEEMITHVQGLGRTTPVMKDGKHTGKNIPRVFPNGFRTVDEPSYAIAASKKLRLFVNTDGCSDSDSRRANSVDGDVEAPSKTIHNNTPTVRFRLEATGAPGRRERDRSIDEPSFTVCGGGHQVGPRVFDHLSDGKPRKIRSLTLEETAALQGFPEDYKWEYDRKRDAWVMIGNAVVPAVAKAVIEGINAVDWSKPLGDELDPPYGAFLEEPESTPSPLSSGRYEKHSQSRAEAFTKNVHENTHESDFRTPPYLFDWIDECWGPIEYDAACHEDGSNALATPLRLESEWPQGSVIYSNPPFDSPSIEKWFDKGRIHANEGGTHVMCLPNKICQTFFSSRIDEIDEIVFLGGRVDFSGPFSVKGGSSRSGTMIVIQHNDDWEERATGGHMGQSACIMRGVLIRHLKAAYKDKQEASE